MVFRKKVKSNHDDEPIERIIMKMVKVIYTVYPPLANKLKSADAIRILDTIVASRMICNGKLYSHEIVSNRHEYGRQMIEYDREVREIADSLDLDHTIVVEFVRSCFAINKADGIYPSMIDGTNTLWSKYDHLKKFFTEPITKLIINYVYDSVSVKELNSCFRVFSRVINQRVSPFEIFIIEGCNYIAKKSKMKKRAPGQSPKIFVDEFINYMREFDEARYMMYEDRIRIQLEKIDDPFSPKCRIILEAFGLIGLESVVKDIRKGFKWFSHEPICRPAQPLTPISAPKIDVPDEWTLPPPQFLAHYLSPESRPL